MKIVIVPDSFKGSLSAKSVASSLAFGIQSVLSNAELVTLPIADGGEGTVEALLANGKGALVNVRAKNPLFKKIEVGYGVLENGLCVIEVASASGLPLLNKKERNPLKTTSLGTGELILQAINQGHKKFIIGLGGSATNDGAIGILHAFGYRFYDGQGVDLAPIGANLIQIKTISDKLKLPQINGVEFLLTVDVTNPLFGIKGAAHVFAEQKGATKDEVVLLDEGLRNFHLVTEQFFEKKIDPNTVGFGAAGGIAFGMVAFFNARLVSGIEFISQEIGLEDEIKTADLVISGEGKIDQQSLDGKVLSGISKLTKKYNKPFVVVGGEITLSSKALGEMGVKASFSISDYPLEQSLDEKITKINLIYLGKEIGYLSF